MNSAFLGQMFGITRLRGWYSWAFCLRPNPMNAKPECKTQGVADQRQPWTELRVNSRDNDGKEDGRGGIND